MPPRVAVLRFLAWLMILLVFGLEAGDYVLRALERTSTGVWQGGTAAILVDTMSSLRALALLALAFVLIVKAGSNTTTVHAAIILALYAGVSATEVVGTTLGQLNGIALLEVLLLSALNAVALLFVQRYPQKLTGFPLHNVLRAFLHPGMIVLASLPPVIAYAVNARGSFALALWGIAIVVLELAYFRANLRLADEEARKRLFWLLEGLVLILFVNSLGPLVQLALFVTDASVDPRPVLKVVYEIVQLGTVACFAVAIVFQDALNAGIVVKRTFAAGFASSVSLIVFIALETLLGEVVAAVLPGQTRLISIVAGVIAALVFKPIQSAAERLFARFASDSVIVVPGRRDPAREIV